RPLRYTVLPDALRERGELLPFRRGRLPVLSSRLADPLLDRPARRDRLGKVWSGLDAVVRAVRHVAVGDGRVGEVRNTVLAHALRVLAGESRHLLLAPGRRGRAGGRVCPA